MEEDIRKIVAEIGKKMINHAEVISVSINLHLSDGTSVRFTKDKYEDEEVIP